MIQPLIKHLLKENSTKMLQSAQENDGARRVRGGMRKDEEWHTLLTTCAE
jgi:hypothetical protein